MSMFYLVRRKVSVIQGERKTLWHAVGKTHSPRCNKTEHDIARMAHQRSTLQESTVIAALSETANILEELLEEGESVTIKGIGTFSLALTSDGFEHPEEVTPSKVRVSRVYFIADRRLTGRLRKTRFIRLPLSAYLPKSLLSTKVIEEETMAQEQEDITPCDPE